MAYSVAIRAVITRAKQRSNLEGADAFITPQEWVDMANQSYAEWYDLVRLTTFGGQYFRSTAQLNTVAGTSSYPLPADHLGILSVDWYVAGTSMVVNILPYQEEHRNVFRFWPIGWLFNQPVFFQEWGPNINFLPTPQSQFTVAINYVPTAQRFGDPSQTFDSINGWEEWMVLDMAMKALAKDGQNDMIATLAPFREAQRARIEGAAASRDMGHAEVVHDVEVGFDDWFS